jgi:hypothetical protein
MQCQAPMNLAYPVRTERVRDFQPPWRTVYVYRCPACGAETRVRAGAFRGRTPEPGRGAILCAQEVTDHE